MKKLIVSFLLLFCIASFAQVGINTTSPDASSMLDIQSNNKGLLIPRMTAAEKIAIATPANGLLIYQTDGLTGFWYYNGTLWANIGTSAPTGWGLTGNTATDPATNFIGTTDDIALNFRVNNTQAGRIGNSTEQGTFFGYQAGLSGPTRSQTAFGYNALRLNSTGSSNTAIGEQALELNASGLGNTAVGNYALNQALTSYNTAIGSNALGATTFGARNTALGQNAGNVNTTGSDNTFLGRNANPSVDNLSNATALGSGASVNASNKVRLGNNAVTATDAAGVFTYNAQSATTSVALPNGRGTTGQVLTTDGAGATSWSTSSTGWGLTGNAGTNPATNFVGTTDNVALTFRTNNIARTRITNKGQIETLNTGFSVFLGESAGFNDDLTANRNTFVGRNAGLQNVSGEVNVAVGIDANRQNVLGWSNIAIGSSALLNNLTNNNTAIGEEAARFTTTGSLNTAIGRFSLHQNTTGEANTTLGHGAGSVNVTGSQNTYIGANADATANNFNNATAIGFEADVNASNKVRLGNDLVTATDAAGVLTYNAQSATTSITFPNIRGTNGQVLTTDGAGLTSWATLPASGTTETASNGLTKTGNDIQLGGNLTATTIITQDGTEQFRINNNSTVGTIIDLQNTGDFRIFDNGTNAFQILDNGTLTMGTTNQFTIDNTGDITRINNVVTSFPATQGTANQVLTNDGAGNLTWATNTSEASTASNGLTLTGNDVTLGGNLTATTILTQDNAEAFRINNNATANTVLDLQSTGDFRILDNGASALQVLDNGLVTVGTTNQFQIDNTGDITRINNVVTSFPATQGTANQVLTNDGAGNLTWATPAGGGTTETASNGLTKTGNDIQLGGNLTANTTITQDAAETLTVANNSTGNTTINLQNTGDFVVQNAGVSALQVQDNGTVGIGTTNQFTVNNTGNITRINNVVTSFPATQGTNGQVLTNNGAGILSWTTVSGADNLGNHTATTNLNLGTNSITNANNITATGTATLGGNAFPTITGTNGQVLTTNGAGLTSWSTVSGGSGWGITGNAGTIAGTNFIGNTDDVRLEFRVNNFRSGLISNSAGSSTFFGFSSGLNTTGIGNTGFGHNALNSNTSAQANTAIGNEALSTNTVGRRNTALGNFALVNSTMGSENVAVGESSLLVYSYNNGTSFDAINTAVGRASLNILNSTSTSNGIRNTALGGYAGFNTQISTDCTFLGAYTSVLTPATAYVNSTAIGYNAVIDASNKVRIGNNAVTVIEGQVPFTNPSDSRLKDNIIDSKLGLDFLMKLRPVQYTMKNGNGKIDYGFIAQELATLVSEKDVNLLNKDGEFYSVRYNDFISPTVKAIQEQQTQIETQKIEIETLKAELKELKKLIILQMNKNK